MRHLILVVTLLNASYNVYGRTGFENISFAKKHVTDEPTVYLQKHNFKRCTTACDTRPACVGISYAKRYKLCLLKIVGIEDIDKEIQNEDDSDYLFVKKKQEPTRVHLNHQYLNVWQYTITECL